MSRQLTTEWGWGGTECLKDVEEEGIGVHIPSILHLHKLRLRKENELSPSSKRPVCQASGDTASLKCCKSCKEHTHSSCLVAQPRPL